VGKPARGIARTAIGNTVAIGAAVGIAASWVKSFSEPRLQEMFERLVQPAAAEKALVGADPSGHPDRMPPAEVADRLSRRVSGRGLSQRQRVLGGHLTCGVRARAGRLPARVRQTRRRSCWDMIGEGSMIGALRVQLRPSGCYSSAVVASVHRSSSARSA
jgi:hypothetical protein